MNAIQTNRALRSRGIRGFNKVSWEFRAPEIINNDQCFYEDLKTCNISMHDFQQNIEIFVLFRNYGPFKDRMSRDIVDNWISKDMFGPISQKCYDILDAQPDLKEWQVKLKETFITFI